MRRCLAHFFLVAVILGAFPVTLVSRETASAAAQQGEALLNEFVVGILTDQSGQRAADDEPILAAIEIAAQEINQYLEEVDSPVRIRLSIADTGGDPERAVELFYDFLERGIRIFLGPTSSAEVAALQPHVRSEGAVIVSPSSTAPSLAIIGDTIFRFSPDDSIQARALSRLMHEEGIQAVVPILRDDVYGTELAHAFEVAFTDSGGAVAPGIRYDPHQVNFEDVSAELSRQVQEAIQTYGADAVAVHLIAFNESVRIFHAARLDSVLTSVRWFGSDGTARSPVINRDPVAAQFALDTRFTASAASLDWDAVARLFYLADQYHARFNDIPTAFAVAAYDAMWVLLHTYLVTQDAQDTEAFAKAFVRSAASYYGAGGWAGLNLAGDRLTGHFDFWTFMEGPGPNGLRRDWGITSRFIMSFAGGSRIERIDVNLPFVEHPIEEHYPAE